MNNTPQLRKALNSISRTERLRSARWHTDQFQAQRLQPAAETVIREEELSAHGLLGSVHVKRVRPDTYESLQSCLTSDCASEQAVSD
ncbi:hypothetical protein [Rhodanobacter ginsengiterrae]|uniref:hypothetical protein n=1 Tax=Rhodanobacter ginsengiterrae TaxID=2008451 RepID=UPI003CE6E817